jgi:phospholipase/carboxylesterase
VHYVEVLTAGARPADALPLVIAIHGLGDRPERFGWLLRDLEVPARVIVPQGLDPWHDGYAWFPIRVWNPDPKRVAAGIRRAANALVAAIGELQRRYDAPGKVVVTGFSQGGMLSFALAIEHPELVAAAFPLAGWLPETMVPTGPPQPGTPRICAFHGVDDEVLPIAPTRKLVRSMDEHGFEVELHEIDRTGHSVSPDIRRRLLSRIATSLRERSKPPTAGAPPATAPPAGRTGE